MTKLYFLSGIAPETTLDITYTRIRFPGETGLTLTAAHRDLEVSLGITMMII